MKQVTITLKVSFPTHFKDTEQIKRNVLRCIPVGLDTSPYCTALPSEVIQEITSYEEVEVIDREFLKGKTAFIKINPSVNKVKSEQVLAAISDCGYTDGSGNNLTMRDLVTREDNGKGFALFLKDFPYCQIVASLPFYKIENNPKFVELTFDKYFDLECELW